MKRNPSKDELDLEPKQKELLDEIGVDVDELRLIRGRSIHDMVYLCNAWTDNTYLVFNGSSTRERDKFIYYIGAENEAELVLLYAKLAVYENIDEDRLERYID